MTPPEKKPMPLRAFFRRQSPRTLAGLLTFFVLLALLWSTLPLQGLTDDDDFYAPAGIQYSNWILEVLTSPGQALEQSRIDAAFRTNNEHPPFAKYVIGLVYQVTHRGLGLFGALDGARAGVSFLAALLGAALVFVLWIPLGPLPAIFAALALFSLPRFFFHSQVATLDVPVAAMVFLTVMAYHLAEHSRRWVWICGGVFGLALLTKLNAPFAAIPCTLFALLTRWRGFSWVKKGAALRLPPIPPALLTMALMGPVLFVAGWPWLWHETFKRLGAYFAFHLNHYPIFLYFQGEIWSKPYAPQSMPFWMAASVIPLPFLALGLWGALNAARSLWRMTLRARPDGDLSDHSERDRLLALVLLQAGFAISIVAFSNVPKYGGEKLFMPFFPLFAVLMADGLRSAFGALKDVGLWLLPFAETESDPDSDSDPDAGVARPLRGAAAWAVGLAFMALLLTPAALAQARYWGGFALSYYAGGIGGLAGATARGYERTYYDIADKELARWLSENTGPQDHIHFEPNHKEYERTYRWLRKDGLIRRDLKLSASKSKATVLVLTHERRWSTYPRLLKEHRAFKVVHEKRIDGVPLYTVHRR
jgi:4-amino-4-deoxy-L-arabinose transferase-like glycosyltransferase